MTSVEQEMSESIRQAYYGYRPEWHYSMGDPVGYKCAFCNVTIRNGHEFRNKDKHEAWCGFVLMGVMLSKYLTKENNNG